MGLVATSIRFLIEARQQGVNFEQTITLGRQHLTVSPQRLCAMLQEHQLWPPAEGEAPFLAELEKAKWRFEVFARGLGAKKVSSMDVSDYEAADVVHNLNVPIGPELHDRFDLVIDGGTLEHVFHAPIALANCMKMVKPGGHVIVFTNINNMVGHGLYQFSPELFFRMYSPENGFEMKRMIAVEDTFGRSSIFGVKYDFPIQGAWYNVHDPDKIQKRNILITKDSLVLMVLAKKVSSVELFRKFPQQSEYAADNQSVLNPANQNSFGRAVIGNIVRRFPEKFWREVLPKMAAIIDPARRWRHRRRNSLDNPDFYSKVRAGERVAAPPSQALDKP